ncbi:hypothetical protein BCR39DRAFT_533862 [Naematelia encephala]|uniref:Uncharacterized protein n=1 Tax=Naematelia encephala TaxID=71784 RepID=A0A1Y2B1S5_9TREE|nr:hypothetical protein BCR39DRAFT_533862 [Naematelia encephala]
MAGLSSRTGTGRRKASASPTITYSPHPSVPKLKLNLRSSSPASPVPSSKPRKSSSQQRKHLHQSSSDSDSSELTPPDEDDEIDVEERITPRSLKTQAGSTPRSLKTQGGHSNSNKKGGVIITPKGKKKSSNIPAGGSLKSITQSGPGGRERKREAKNGERERRRARDEKFSMDLGEGYNAVASSSRTSRPISTPASDAETESSYGDDEAEGTGPTFADIGHESDDDAMPVLPDGLVGQEVEDLAYGAGEMFTLNGWGDEDDEEDDEVFIAQLSGSEADVQSQSSVQESNSDAVMSDSDEVSTSDDEVDEFGFPVPSSASLFPKGSDGTPEAPLVLMENWDGQLVLVQPRQERSRSRRRGSRGSHTNASIADSMVTSTADPQGGLRIDPDAADGEFDSDSSFWSGESDKGGDGDTTDSMDEDDMPMLDSPALQGIIEQQMMNVGIANAPSPIEMNGGPSIVITDAEAEALTSTLADIDQATSVLASIDTPQTPAPIVPTMGTFHPAIEHPSQHAVIDGSKTTTKSPFTHRRRPGRGRDGQSVASSREESKDRKRKSPTQPFDPFSPVTPSAAALAKRARYSSIPGHPRFRRAHQAEYEERAITSSDEEEEEDCVVPMDLEEMIHESVMAPPVRESPERHFRFDRVRVEGYLRRTLMSGGQRDTGVHVNRQPFSSPTAASGGAMLRLGGGITDTLMGHLGGPLSSPVLQPVENRRDRRRRERARDVVIPLQI